MNISIFGLGYVGAVSLACLARDGHRVIGVDVDQAKLDLIAAGKTPVVEEGMVELMAHGRRERPRLGHAATRGRPSRAPSSRWSASARRRRPTAARTSRRCCASRRISAPRCATSRRRTSSSSARRSCPGTVEDVLRPILERESGKKDGVDFHVCFQPEFLREGSSIRDYDKPPFTIVGRHRRRRRWRRCGSSSATCRASSTSTSIRAAEMVKYAATTSTR